MSSSSTLLTLLAWGDRGLDSIAGDRTLTRVVTRFKQKLGSRVLVLPIDPNVPPLKPKRKAGEEEAVVLGRGRK